jgi:hypothetical protein
MEANTITNKVEENFAVCANVKMIESDDEEENTMPKTTILEDAMIDGEEEGMEPVTPTIETNSNDVSNTCKEVNFAQYV